MSAILINIILVWLAEPYQGNSALVLYGVAHAWCFSCYEGNFRRLLFVQLKLRQSYEKGSADALRLTSLFSVGEPEQVK